MLLRLCLLHAMLLRTPASKLSDSSYHQIMHSCGVKAFKSNKPKKHICSYARKGGFQLRGHNIQSIL